jgi:hypothetical protein
LPRRTLCDGPRTEAAGLTGIDLARHQPVEQAPHGGKLLLDAGRGQLAA